MKSKITLPILVSSWCSNKIILSNRSREVKTCWRWTSLGSGTWDKQTSVAAVNIEGSAQQAFCLYFSRIKQTHSDFMRGKTWSSNNSQVEECLGHIPWMFIPLWAMVGSRRRALLVDFGKKPELFSLCRTKYDITDLWHYKLSGHMFVEDVFCSFFLISKGREPSLWACFFLMFLSRCFFKHG